MVFILSESIHVFRRHQSWTPWMGPQAGSPPGNFHLQWQVPLSSLRHQDSWPCSCAPYVASTSLVVCSFRGSWSYKTHPSNFLEKAGQNQGKVSKSTNHRNQGIANNNCTQLGAMRDARFTGVIHPERITHHVHWFFLHCFELTFSPAYPFQNPCSFPSLGWINIVAKF